MGEATLPHQVLANRLALDRSPRDMFGLAVHLEHMLFDLIERPDAGLHRKLTELMGVHRIVVPAFGARIERVDEGRPADGQRLAHHVHRLNRIPGANGRDVPAVGMTRRQHRRRVLFPAPVHDAMQLARRAESGVHTIRRGPRHLDVGVGVRLVVVHQDQQVVMGVLECGRNG